MNSPRMPISLESMCLRSRSRAGRPSLKSTGMDSVSTPNVFSAPTPTNKLQGWHILSINNVDAYTGRNSEHYKQDLICYFVVYRELRRRLAIEGVVTVVKIMRGRLRWFGHVEHKEVDDFDLVSACRNLEVAGSRGRGRPRMIW